MMQIKVRESNNPSGRPRSAEVTERLHQAVWMLLDAHSWQDLTMERIAEQAGVSRPALYRRYSGVGEVVLGALLAVGESALAMPYSDSLERDLQFYFEAVVSSLKRDGPVGKALRGVLSRALTDGAFAPQFERFIVQRREPVRRRVASGLPNCTQQQVDGLLDKLFGPVLYRLLIRGVAVRKSKIADMIGYAVRPMRA